MSKYLIENGPLKMAAKYPDSPWLFSSLRPASLNKWVAGQSYMVRGHNPLWRDCPNRTAEGDDEFGTVLFVASILVTIGDL